MKRKRLLIGLVAAMAGAVFLSCVSDSALSDTDLTNPSLLDVSFTVQKKTRKPSGTVSYTFDAVLTDKKGNGVEIRNGGVYLNGIKMKVDTYLIGGGPYYKLTTSAISYKPDSLYTFKVVLSDGSEYASTVRTSAYGLDSARATIESGYASFSWTGDHSHAVRVDYVLSKTVNDTVKQLSGTESFTVQDSSNVKIPMQGYTSLHSYDFSSVVTGTVHTGFRSGSARAIVQLSY